MEGLLFMITKRVITVKMEHRERWDENSSGYTFIKSLALFINGLTSFSVKPLRISSFLGALFAIFGIPQSQRKPSFNFNDITGLNS